jgi:hypothetical protein
MKDAGAGKGGRATMLAARRPWTMSNDMASKAGLGRATTHSGKRTCIGVAVLGIVVLSAATVRAEETPSPKAEETPSPKAAVSSSKKAESPDLVQAALRAEASGDRESRGELLREALKKNPGSLLAHWCAGQVRQGGKWTSLDEVQRKAAADKRLAMYQKLREQHADAPDGLRDLAAWCRSHGLPAESRVHWLQLLELQPDDEEALRALNARWYHGQLLTEAQFKQAMSQQRKPQTSCTDGTDQKRTEHWTSKVIRWRRELKEDEPGVKKSLCDVVAATKEPLAIHGLGAVLINGSYRKQDRDGYRKLSLGLVDALDQSEKPWAMAELTWQAVQHPTPAVRDAATAALKKRPKEFYVPWLVSHMETPIQTYIVVKASPLGGGFMVDQTLDQEGLDAIYREVRQSSIDSRFVIGAMQKGSQVERYLAGLILPRLWGDAKKHAEAQQKQVDRANTQIAEFNRRIARVLAETTDEPIGDDPLAWQKWWTTYCCNYYELEPEVPNQASCQNQPQPEAKQPEAAEKPIVMRQYLRYVTLVSCFPANTTVWTLTGPARIADVKPGDRVLTQQPFTGELSYQPVLQVTRRKPTSLIEIGLGSETIRATRGHPFWVCGQGWRMAKELEVGQWLHGIDGPVRVDRLEQLPAADPEDAGADQKPAKDLLCNLVLEEHHNYFVSRQKVLAHDNTFFPADGPVPAVPGLASE